MSFENEYADFMESIKPNQSDSPDPLDAYMEEITKQATAQKEFNKKDTKKGERVDIERDNEVDSLDYTLSQNEAIIQKTLNEISNRKGGEIDSDEEVYATAKAVEKFERMENPNRKDKLSEIPKISTSSKIKVPDIPEIDHSNVSYRSFKRDFNSDNNEVSDRDNSDFILKKEIKISGGKIPKACQKFSQMSINPLIKKHLAQSFQSPTPIQSQAVPCALSGRDVIAVAPTGSGKTISYCLPLIEIVSLNAFPPTETTASRCKPLRALVLAPTQELCTQIHETLVPLCGNLGHTNLSVAALHSGMSYHMQNKVLGKGVDIAVGTPGRVINLMKRKVFNSKEIILVVLDEADRMMQMGFKNQIKTILGQIRPDRQTLMFSATYPNEIRYLSNALRNNKIEILVGNHGSVNKNIEQRVEILANEESKQYWLNSRIAELCLDSKVLVFAGTKENCEKVASGLRNLSIYCGVLHGEIAQQSRRETMSRFKSGNIKILVATDIAARGLHVPGIQYIVNYSSPKDPQTYVNRLGRAGRENKKAVAYTLLAKNEVRSARVIRSCLRKAKQNVPNELSALCDLKNETNSKKRKFQQNSNTMAFAGLQTSKTVSQRNTKPLFGSDRAEEIKKSFSSGFVRAADNSGENFTKKRKGD